MESADRQAQNTFVKSWLRVFFSRLEQRGAVFVGLRVDSSLFRPNCEIDVLVHPGSLSAVLEEIRHVCGAFPSLRVAYWNAMPRHAATIILTWDGGKGDWEHFFLDIRCGIRKQGKLLFDGSSLRRDLTVWDPDLGLRRLTDEYEAALLLLRNTLDGRLPSSRHVEILRTRNSGDVAQATQALGWRNGNDLNAASAALPVPRVSLKRSGTLVAYAGRAMWGRIRRRTLSLNIVIYGPDGVGKSTQADLLADFFRHVGIRNVHVYHHLTGRGALPSGGSPKPATAAKRHVYRTVSRPSTVNAVVTLSYLKKLWVVLSRIRPLLRRGHVVIHDRYLLDVFQKFQKSRGFQVPWLERVLPRLTPREPFVMVLLGSPEVISARTGELSPDEVAASYELLFECLAAAGDRVDGWTTIDANRSAEDVHKEIVDHVVAVQTHRAMSIP